MDVLDQLVKSTVRLVCDNDSIGTGFFYEFDMGDGKTPAIITNKHVIEGANKLELVISMNDYFSSPNKKVETFTVNYEDFQPSTVYHSDDEVDLCAIIISNIVRFQIEKKLNFDIIYLDDSLIPSEEVLQELRFVENVLMIGYPIGLADLKNNLPIFRTGVTATHPAVDFNGNPEFIVDMTITPGSSGSPVFIYDSGSYKDRYNNLNIGNDRVLLVGINKAVYTQTALGEIREHPAPTNYLVESEIGINLGVIVKSQEIYNLKKRIEEHPFARNPLN